MLTSTILKFDQFLLYNISQEFDKTPWGFFFHPKCWFSSTWIRGSNLFKIAFLEFCRVLGTSINIFLQLLSDLKALRPPDLTLVKSTNWETFSKYLILGRNLDFRPKCWFSSTWIRGSKCLQITQKLQGNVYLCF